MTLMERKNTLRAFERGVRAMLGQGIKVRVDLIVGLPGDTVESVRRGLHYLRDGGLYTDLQVFNLAVLPGTAFRHEAKELGLVHQPRPPYYALRTPTLDQADLFSLIQEAQELFEIELDAQPAPVLDVAGTDRLARINLDDERFDLPPAGERSQAFTLWLRGTRFDTAAALIRRVLDDNPYTTLQVVLEPIGETRHVTPALLESLLAVCQERPTYLDKFYALQPGRPNGAKRLIVVLPAARRRSVDPDWLTEIGATASVVWRGADVPVEQELDAFEYVAT
jgi:hypothetical protein